MDVGGRVQLGGVAIDALTQAEVVDHILGALAAGSGGTAITPNLHHLREVDRTPALRHLYDDADLVLADGMPLIWASRILGTPLPERVPGSGLIWTLSEAAAEHGRSCFLLGGDPGTAVRAAEILVERYPRLEIAGTHCPPLGYESDPAHSREIIERLRAAEPDIVFVGLGFPKQDVLGSELVRTFPGAWYLGVGISFSFVSGDVARAPEVIQRAGLEWAHRLIQEPGRLARRYLLEGAPFALRLLGRAVLARRAPSRTRRAPP